LPLSRPSNPVMDRTLASIDGETIKVAIHGRASVAGAPISRKQIDSAQPFGYYRRL